MIEPPNYEKAKLNQYMRALDYPYQQCPPNFCLSVCLSSHCHARDQEEKVMLKEYVRVWEVARFIPLPKTPLPTLINSLDHEISLFTKPTTRPKKIENRNTIVPAPLGIEPNMKFDDHSDHHPIPLFSHL